MPPDAASTASPPDPALVLFARGVIARLELWPALRVAVEQGWGGPSSREKRRWLASEIVDAFDDEGGGRASASASASASAAASTPDAEYVALMLVQVLEDEFDASFEDGSVEAVAADIVALWGAGEDVVSEWERKAEGARGNKVDVREGVGDEDEDEDDDDDDEGDDGPSQLMPAASRAQRSDKHGPITDEDGFTLVGKGRP
ncbi:Pre-rRNA-processing protein TSR2-domain-containing protein [Russula earlei]|uniref:Pre-rRNA-processing protein TSR2-domain-containing protein n=1 Tax=Russula earlei TaxID=71964 RepID=A0ACC0UNX1_9AGAM|nr:Pre-rRNA-processing protein TSR2-domain-containing protein [Russula earlei]